jgi:hypothetical protein
MDDIVRTVCTHVHSRRTVLTDGSTSLYPGPFRNYVVQKDNVTLAHSCFDRMFRIFCYIAAKDDEGTTVRLLINGERLCELVLYRNARSRYMNDIADFIEDVMCHCALNREA